MIDVGLIERSMLEGLPAELAQRLDELLSDEGRLNMYSTFDVDDLPWLKIAVCSIVGFVAGLFVKVRFWQKTLRLVSVLYSAMGRGCGWLSWLCILRPWLPSSIKDNCSRWHCRN